MRNTIAKVGESCDSACGRLPSNTTAFECSTQGLYALNSCDTLKAHFGCSICEKDFVTFGPAVNTSKSAYDMIMQDILGNGRKMVSSDMSVCVVASHTMLLNCDN